MENKSNGKTIAALVLGIAGVVLSFIPYVSFIGLVAAIVGLVFAIGERKKNPSGMATAAMVLSIIALVFWVISIIVVIACAGAITSTILGAM